MGACGEVENRKSTCLYIDKEILETAKQIGNKNMYEKRFFEFG